MNVVNCGAQFQIYGEDVKTYVRLPLQSYDVCFNKMTGFYLTLRTDLQVDEKIYGKHSERADKVMKSYTLSQRNFGIILSGQKGIGKSLFARLLATKALSEYNMPVIVVSYYYPGIADFLGSIKQECVVIFDEFEKTFAEHDDFNPQIEMLSLFDGLDCGKKLFVITCNEVGQLNTYMLNRPGRFHYHIKISSPTDEEIIEYLHDNLREEYWDTINQIIGFSHGINMTYDFLRAIVFELNQGYSLKETLGDLNISDTEIMNFDIVLALANGMRFYSYGFHMDLASRDIAHTFVASSFSNGDKYTSKRLYVGWNPADIEVHDGCLMLPPKCFTIEPDSHDLWNMNEEESATYTKEIENLDVVGLFFDKVQTYSKSRFLDV